MTPVTRPEGRAMRAPRAEAARLTAACALATFGFGFANLVGAILSGFFVSRETVLMQLGAALIVGVVAAAIPAWRAGRVPIVDGLRAIG